MARSCSSTVDDLKNASYIFTALSVPIAIFGIASNALSLSYFACDIKSNRRSRNGENRTTKLFATLNVFDLLVSMTASLALIMNLTDYEMIYSVFYGFMIIFVNVTSFLTCLLATVRAIHLVFPLYAIKWKAVSISIAVWFAITMPVQFLLPCHSSFFLLPTLFLIVVVVNVVSLAKLCQSQSTHTETRDAKRRATITVAIVSVIFCVLNVGFLVAFYCNSFDVELPSTFALTADFILLPLNSACNPLVYIIRKEDMRSHVKSLWRRLGECLCNKSRENSTGLGLPEQPTSSTLCGEKVNRQIVLSLIQTLG